jgi:NADH dehydrogenase
MEMKVLLTGATGFVGREVTRQALAQGHHLRALVRDVDSASSRRLATRRRLELVRGDILTPETLAPALDGCDAIIHLVGIISEVGQQTYERVHITGTENLLEAATRMGVRQFIHMSALGARPEAASRYHRSKWAAEELVRRSGLAYTIFRPSIIYGPGDGFVNLFDRLSRFSPILPIMGDGKNKLQPIPVEQVAQCFVAALNEARAKNETFDLCGPEALSFEELLDLILAVLQRERLKLHLPLRLARLQARVLEWVFPKLLKQAPPLNRDQLLMLQEDNVGNPAPAVTLFGLSPVAVRRGLAAYLPGSN